MNNVILYRKNTAFLFPSIYHNEELNEKITQLTLSMYWYRKTKQLVSRTITEQRNSPALKLLVLLSRPNCEGKTH